MTINYDKVAYDRDSFSAAVIQVTEHGKDRDSLALWLTETYGKDRDSDFVQQCARDAYSHVYPSTEENPQDSANMAVKSENEKQNENVGNWDHVDYSITSWYGSAIINGDYSSFDYYNATCEDMTCGNCEACKLNAFLQAVYLEHGPGHWSTDSQTNYGTCDITGQDAEIEYYKYVIQPVTVESMVSFGLQQLKETDSEYAFNVFGDVDFNWVFETLLETFAEKIPDSEIEKAAKLVYKRYEP